MVRASLDCRGDPLGDIRRHAGRKDLLVVPDEPLDDLNALLAGLSLAENHLRKARADRAVKIKLRATDIIIGKGAKTLDRLRDRHIAGFHLFEEFFEPGGIHLSCLLLLQNRVHASRPVAAQVQGGV